MRRYIALLRAINVGGHVVRMDDLRRHFEALGFSNAATMIASGNVIFDTTARNATALETRIENHLQQALGYAVATFIRSCTELARIATYQPFPEEIDRGHSLYVTFLKDQPDGEAQKKLLALRTRVDDLHIHGREVYWLRRSSLGESAFSGALLEKTIRMPGTARNMTTVRKLAAKYPAAE